MTEGPVTDPRALHRAMMDVIEHVHAAGWGTAPSLFALVPTDVLAGFDYDDLGARLDDAPLTAIEQDPLPEGIEGGSPELEDFLGRTSWSEGIVGAVLAQEVLVIAADDADEPGILGEDEGLGDDATSLRLDEVQAATGSAPARRARLFTGIVVEGPELAVFQVQPTEEELAAAGPFAEDDIRLHDGREVAGGVLSALRATF